eukprot:1531739-Ditylum_brightwellii.AAC.1
MDIDVGKNISAWDDILDGNVFGSYPPVCSDITTEAEKVQAEVCVGFMSRNQYYLSGNWIDEPNLGVKSFAMTIDNQAALLDNMSKK